VLGLGLGLGLVSGSSLVSVCRHLAAVVSVTSALIIWVYCHCIIARMISDNSCLWAWKLERNETLHIHVQRGKSLQRVQS